MLLVWLTFLIGAPLEQLACVSLRDPEYEIFKQVSIGMVTVLKNLLQQI